MTEIFAEKTEVPGFSKYISADENLVSKGFKKCWKTKEWTVKEACETCGRGEGCKHLNCCPIYKLFTNSQPPEPSHTPS